MKLLHRLVTWSLLSACACGDATPSADERHDDAGMDAPPGNDHSDGAGPEADADAEARNDAADLDADSVEDAIATSDAAADDAAADDAAADDAAADDAAADDAATDGAAAADDAAADAPPAVPIADPEQSGFVAYGQLEVTFDRPVDASTLSASLSPARPAGLSVTQIAQASANRVSISLNTYHLPLDYTLTLESPAFSLEVTLPGLGNGSRSVFVSSHLGTGDLRSWMPEVTAAESGRAAGDAICQSEADAAGLKGAFRAFLSSDESADPYDAACRMLDRTGTWAGNCGLAQPPVDEAPLIDQGGLPVVNGASGVAKGQWLSTIRYRANGDAASGHVWTGSSATGRSAGSNADCLGFVDAGATPRAAASADPHRYLPDYFYSLSCDESEHLLCVQTGAGFFAPSTLHTRTGKAVFITTDVFAYPSTGSALPAADAFCQDAAKSASHANFADFVAWMSEGTEHAPCRLVASGGPLGADKCGLGSWPSTGPWVRHDGFMVAANMTELLSGTIAAPLLYDAAGAFLDDSTWTITNTWNDGTPAGACSGGIATGTAAWSLYYSPRSCSFSQRLLCFER